MKQFQIISIWPGEDSHFSCPDNVSLHKPAGFISGCQKNPRGWCYQGGYIHLSELLMCGFVFDSSRRKQATIHWFSRTSSKPNAGHVNLIQLVKLWHADKKLSLIDLILASVLNFLCKFIVRAVLRAYATRHTPAKSVRLTWTKRSRWAVLHHTSFV